MKLPKIPIALLPVLAAILTACGETPAPPPADPVTVQLKWVHQAQFAGFYVALERGYYAHENLDVRLLEGGQGVDIARTLASGRADFAVLAPEDILIQRARGHPLVAIAAIYRRSAVVFVSLPDAGILRPANFAGKTIAVGGGAGAVRDFDLRFEALVRRLGLDRKAMRPVPYDPAYAGLLDHDAVSEGDLRGCRAMKLYPKLLLLFLAFAALPTAVLGAFAYRSSRQSIEERTTQHLVSTNLLKQAQLDRWIGDNARALETLASSLRLTRDIEGEVAAHRRADARHELTHVAIRQQYLLPLVAGSGFFELFILGGDDGLVLVSSDRKSEGKYFDDRPFFLRGRERTFAQTVYYSMTLQQPAMTVSTPIRDRKGRLVTVLAGHLDLADLSAIMTQGSGLSRSEDTYIVNNFNFFLTEPRFGRGYALRKSVHTEGVRSALAGRDGVASYPDYRGRPVIGAYRWVDQWQVALLTEIDRSEAFAPIAALGRAIGWVCAGVVLMAVGLGWLGARRVARPLRELAVAAERIGGGDLGFRAPQTGGDEIGDLSRAFERMTRQLRETLVSRDALEAEVAERTAAQARLQATLTDLERSNRELEQFAYVASHDLQEPLRMVSSYTRLAERYRGRLDDKADKYIHYAVDGAVRMQQLIQDLLAFSRVATRGGDFETVDSRSVVDRALNDLHAATVEAGARITCGDLPAVRADPDQLRQVFQNLVGNAVKFRGNRPLRIHVSARSETGRWVFSVRDNGIGIDPRYAEKVFVIFQRLHPRSAYPGTGIGLALCQRSVQRHGGRIWFESEPEQGTTFHFTLPKK